MAENVPANRPKYELAAMEAKSGFMAVVNDEIKFKKEVMFAFQVLRGNELLQKCDPQSIQNAVVNLALTGATLNPALAQAYLVPRGGKCCLDISYRGLVKIATDSGSVIDIDATVVYEKDEFDYEMGLTPRLKHIPSLEPDPGKPMFVYAVAIFPSGYRKFIVLNRKEIDKVKATSKASSGPWVQWESEMMRKTAVKKLYKLLPQTDRMGEAIALVNEAEGLETRGKRTADTSAIADRFKPSTTEQTVDVEAGEVGMTAEQEAEIRKAELTEHGTDQEREESGLFS